jgi:TolB-like protein/Flp pilus assembly protein TadD
MLMAELKRRHVLKVVAVYAAAAFAVMQAADFLVPALRLPDAFASAIAFTALVGFPVAVGLAWVFDLTPQGVRRTDPAASEELEAIVAEPRLRRWGMGVLALLTTVVFVLGGWWVLRDTPEGVAPSGAAVERSIAVLPFADLSGDPGNEYFGDGLAEELMNALNRIPSLKVAARTSAFSFKGRNADVQEIGGELGVSTVLEGSVRRSGDRIRVTAQLVDVADGFPIWSENYSAELTDIFTIQEEIAQSIVAALKVRLTVPQGGLVRASTPNVEAYNRYLRGRYFWNQRTLPSFRLAIEEYNQAIELDPDYAQAYAGLAETYVLLPEYGGASIPEIGPNARAAVEKALALDPNSSAAYTASGYLKYRFEWDWAGAEADFQRAIDLEPDYATAHQWYAELLIVLRRFDEARTEAKTAYELDPLAPAGILVRAITLELDGQMAAAIEEYKATLELAPDFAIPTYFLALAYVHLGDLSRADSTFQHLAGLTDTDPATYRAYIDVLDEPEMIPAATAALTTSPVFGLIAEAEYLATLGQAEATLAVLEQAYEDREPFLPLANALAPYEALRSDPRFIEFLRKMKL